MNSTTPDVQSLSAPSRFVLAPALAAALGAASGCSQEGKTVQAVLPVQGLAYDASAVTVTSNTLGDTIAVLANLKLKIQTTYANGCEARGGLELRAEGTTGQPLYVITPLSRYTADEGCNVGLAGDTLQVLTINGVRMNVPPLRDGSGVVSVDSVARFEVRGFGAPPIRFDVSTRVASRNDTATGYFVDVQDKDTGAPIDGAVVRVERYATPDVLGEGTTSGGGRFAFDVACSDSAGVAADSYVVKVSHAARITILTVTGAPSLCKRRETIIVRV